MIQLVLPTNWVKQNSEDQQIERRRVERQSLGHTSTKRNVELAHWSSINDYLGGWDKSLPEILEPMEQGYLGGQIPTPFELGDMNCRIESIQRDANHEVVLEWLVVDGNERITNGHKLLI